MICPIHKCKIKNNADGQLYCEICEKDEPGEKTAGKPGAGGSLCSGPESACQVSNEGCESADMGSQVIPSQQHFQPHLSTGSSYLSPVQADAEVLITPAPGEPGHSIYHATSTSTGTASADQKSEISDPGMEFNRPYIAPPAAIGVQTIEEGGAPAFSGSVTGIGDGHLLGEVNNALSQMGACAGHPDNKVLPVNIELLRTQRASALTADELEACYLEYMGEVLLSLPDLLKRGLVIVRVFQPGRSIVLFHIRPAGNQAVLIVDSGESSSPIDPEQLSMMLTNVLALVPGSSMEVYLYTGAELVADEAEQKKNAGES